MKKKLLILLAALLTFVLVACGEDEETDTAEQNELEEVEFTDDELVDEDLLVIQVNEKEILGNEYNNIYRQLKTLGHMYGQDVSDHDLLRADVTTYLVEQELIRQDAVVQGIVVTEEEVDVEINQIKEENDEDTVAAMLEQYEITEDEFRNQLLDDLTLLHYIEKTLEVEVTDSEVEELFEQYKEEDDALSDEDYEEYESLIRQRMTEQKQSELLESRIEELHEAAEIEILI